MIQNKIFSTIKRYSMINPGDSLVLAVSGGADSMCMLHSLMAYAKINSVKITVAHVNHSLRGEESDRDQLFVEDFCRKKHIDCFVKKVDVFSLSKELNIGLEECGRKVRYDFFNELAGKNGKIATAHTASDNLETMIFNISRGSGIRGISAVSPKRDNIIRPLIEITAEEARKYCSDNNLQYVIDSTNLKDVYTRNFIRHNIIPKLKELNPNIESKATALSQSAREDDGYLFEKAQMFLQNFDEKIDKKAFLELPLPIQKRTFMLLLKKYGIAFQAKLYDKIIDSIKLQKKFDISKNYYIYSDKIYFEFRLKDKIKNCTDDFEFKALDLFENNKKINNKSIFLYKLEKIEKTENLLFINQIDCDIINQNTLLRNRRPGDYFKQANRRNTKKLKKLFNELKLSENERSERLILANGSEVLWIEGIGASQKASVNKNTKQIAIIEVTEENKNDD